MKSRILVAVSAIIAFAVAGSLSPVRAEIQQNPPKKQSLPQTPPVVPESKTVVQGGGLGGMDASTMTEQMAVMMPVDSMMQRMTMLMKRAQSYSKSFGELAEVHHGADKKEILMMQRMADSMGMMAGEIKVSLQQYKDMLDDETSSESGSMRVEVHSFKATLDGIASYIEQATNTLQMLEERLGQG